MINRICVEEVMRRKLQTTRYSNLSDLASETAHYLNIADELREVKEVAVLVLNVSPPTLNSPS